MKAIIDSIRFRAGKRIEYFGKNLYKPVVKKNANNHLYDEHLRLLEIKRWYHDQGDFILRLNYENLNENSYVIDIGGYKGQWASDIFSKYQANILIFEPVAEYCDLIQNRFSKNNKIQVFNYGLGSENKKSIISLSGAASSLHNIKNEPQESIEIRSISETLKSLNLNKIDLMKINIEGEEYEVIDDLFNSKLISTIQNLQIQFHNFVDDAKGKINRAHEILEKTHKRTYSYRFVWENWVINDI